jgi:tetratricopeptide (TPR) repeat protein
LVSKLGGGASSRKAKDDLPVLSGTAVFTTTSESGKEKVITYKEGNENLYWRKDPLTNQVWTVKAKVKREVPKDYDLTLVSGSLKVDWELRAKEGGEPLSRGSDEYFLSKSLGGYQEDLNKSPKREGDLLLKTGETQEDSLPLAALSEELLNSLSQMAADKLLITLRPKGLKLAHAHDSRSLRAERMAREGLWEEAALVWRELLSENPYYHPALYNLGLFYEREGELDSAWSCFRSAFLSSQETLYRNALARLSLILWRTGYPPRVREGFF